MNFFQMISLWACLWEFLIPQVIYGQQFQFVSINDTLTWSCPSGESRKFHLPFVIREGYHIQSNTITDDNLIPTSITLNDLPEDIQFEDAVFPEPSDFRLAGSNVPMKVFHNDLTIRFFCGVKKNTKSGTSIIRGILHYQACDSVKCFFPRDLPFTISFVVSE